MPNTTKLAADQPKAEVILLRHGLEARLVLRPPPPPAPWTPQPGANPYATSHN
ncbi:MAG: hypothetical protein WCE78_15765 [Pseudonocardiaceae bacterium]